MSLLSVYDAQEDAYWGAPSYGLFGRVRWTVFEPDMYRRYMTTHPDDTFGSTTHSIHLQDIALPFGQKSIPALWPVSGGVFGGSPLAVNAPHSPPYVSIK